MAKKPTKEIKEYKQPNSPETRQTGEQLLIGRLVRTRGKRLANKYIKALEEIEGVRTVPLDDTAYRSLSHTVALPFSNLPNKGERQLSVFNIELFLFQYGLEDLLPSDVLKAVSHYTNFSKLLDHQDWLAWDKRLNKPDKVFLTQEQQQLETWRQYRGDR